MEKPSKIIRRSIYTFLQNYQHFTSIASLLAFPFSLSILLSRLFLPSFFPSLLPTIYDRLRTLFQAAGFPPTSEFFTSLKVKLSQTISQSIFTLPFTFSFLLLAKAYVIISLNQQKPNNSPPSPRSILSIFGPLLHTYVCNSILILSANATAFCLLFFSFNFLVGLGFSIPLSFLFLSALSALLYSIILANTLMISNLALVLSGTEQSGGYLSILKACVMIQGRASIALSLAVPVNLALAGLEALFQFRIVRVYYTGEMRGCAFMALEGILIAYLYSIFLVLETVVSCNFYKSCKASPAPENQEGKLVMKLQRRKMVGLKVPEELP